MSFLCSDSAPERIRHTCLVSLGLIRNTAVLVSVAFAVLMWLLGNTGEHGIHKIPCSYRQCHFMR